MEQVSHVGKTGSLTTQMVTELPWIQDPGGTMKSSKKWLALIVLLVIVYVGWKYLWPGGEAADRQARAEDPSLLLDRVWIDSKPDKYTDYVHAALFIDDIPMGLFQKASAYHVILEIFEFKRSDNKVKVHFPQSDKKRQFSYRITSCDELPPFDLCLHINKHPWGGPKRYYGVRETDDERAYLGDLRSQLEARLAGAGTR